MNKPKYPIESVDNALRLLLQFKDQEVIGVSDAGELLGVAPSTAHRLLAMLQYRGFAVQDEDSRVYRAGPALLEVGLEAVRDMDLRQHARPVIERLSKELDETVHLLAREGSDVRFVDGVESSKILRVTVRTGVLLPAHCTAGGKAMLAELDSERLRTLYPDARLPALTTSSLRRRTELEKELAEIRERGYATNFGESEEDVTAIGAVVRDRLARVRGAIGVAVPASRMSDRRSKEIVAALMDTCEEVGASIE